MSEPTPSSLKDSPIIVLITLLAICMVMAALALKLGAFALAAFFGVVMVQALGYLFWLAGASMFSTIRIYRDYRRP